MDRNVTPMPPPQTLSVAIITKNEEENLARTLASVQFADEIIVLDSSSTDRTVEIARAFNAKVYDEAWKGFAGSKNSAIAKCTGTWILSLDADEELSPQLQQQIRTLLPSNPPTDAYSAVGSSMAVSTPIRSCACSAGRPRTLPRRPSSRIGRCMRR
jgi:glycosyltransferase involved in cell wall biosynthesis